MFEKIKKRDGIVYKFDSSKIAVAIAKAGKITGEFDEKEAKKITLRILAMAHELHLGLIPEVEEIQDIVERVLLDSLFYKTAKAYIIYREQHTQMRNLATKANVDLIEHYIQKSDWKVKENSNMCYSLQGLNNYISSDITSEYWLSSIYPKEIRLAHKSGDIHIHDLGLLANYCCGWSLQDLLIKGFKGVEGKVASAPAKHLRSALGQLVNFMYTLSGEAAGAMAVSNFDTLLAPFVRCDNLDYVKVKQAIQEFIFNMNVPTRVGFQPVFSNISIDLQIPQTLKDQPVIIGGELQEKTYHEFQYEADIINKAFAEVMMEGDANGKIFSFPIPTYNITKDFDWDNPNLDMVWKMTGKFGVPYFSNFINSNMSPDQITSMCPLTGDTSILVKSDQKGIRVSTIGNIINAIELKKTKYKVFYNGVWSNAKPVKIPVTKVYRITLSNGSSVKMGKNHLQPTKSNGVIKAEDLKVGMWLPFNKADIGTKIGSFDLGYCVGAYAGDGSKDRKAIMYSLDANKKDDKTEKKLVDFWSSLCFETTTTISKKNVRFVRINGNPYDIIKRYILGDNALNKHFSKHVLNSSIEFKKGIIAGYRATDGARGRKRLYTSSVKMREDLMILFNTLGKKSLGNYKDNREGRYGKNTNYRIDYPERTNYGSLYKEDNKYNYYSIVSIEEVDTTKMKYLYCFEVDSDSKLFTLANGLVTHNCRLRIDHNELDIRGGGLFGSAPLTGSIGVVTINLPRIGYIAKNKQEYINILTKYYQLSVNSLVIKRKMLERFTDRDLYPYSKFYLNDTKQRTGKYWKNHFSTIGIIGMNECCLNLFNEDIGGQNGQEFAIEIMDVLRSLLKDTQKETGNAWNLEATPAEGCSYSLPLKDKKLYPEIICANEDDYQKGAAPYYTNSTQLPVNYTDDILEALTLQDELQTKYTGGTVFHVFLGELVSDIDAIKSLIKKIATGFKLPYFTLSPIFSICPSHGYLNGEQKNCPTCDQETEVYSRITGYLRPVKQWNPGKQSEFNKRKTFNKN